MSQLQRGQKAKNNGLSTNNHENDVKAKIGENLGSESIELHNGTGNVQKMNFSSKGKSFLGKRGGGRGRIRVNPRSKFFTKKKK